MPDISEAIEACCAGSRPFALVSLLEAVGSTPAKLGAQALVDGEGAIVGTIGGGALEAEAQRHAIDAIRVGQPRLFEFSLSGLETSASDPICGGRLRVLIDPTARRHRAAYGRRTRVRQRRTRGVLLTRVRRDIPADGCPTSVEVSVEWVDETSLERWSGYPSPAALRRVLLGEQVEHFKPASTDPQTEVLAEAVIPRPRLLIVGGGHVGQALARQAGLVGFDLVVVDDREEFTRAELFPRGTETCCGNIREQLAAFPFGRDTFVALVTRGHRSDAEALEICLRKPRAYLGMIGSRRKVAMMRAAFLETGRASAEEWDQIHAPIGLDIGAVTVPEIAASVVAQLIAVRRTRCAPCEWKPSAREGC